jgi:tol-pal system protein YbgF
MIRDILKVHAVTVVAAASLLATVVLGGCALQKDVDVVERQMVALNQEFKTMDSQLTRLEQKVSQMEGVRRNQAVVGTQLDQIQLDIGRLGGKVEEVVAKTNRQEEKIGQMQQGQMTSILDLQKGVEDLNRRMNRLASTLGLPELASTAPGSEGSPGEKRPPDTGQATGAPSAPPGEQKALGPQALYDRAMQLFRAGDFPAARDGFTRYLGLYPKTDLAKNVQFWLGECYFAEKKYDEAIVAYDKLVKEYPKSEKASSAWLKMGMAFLEKGDKDAGKIALRKVIRDYPQSNQAQIAQKKLSQIK